jgi:hypothetical protein
LTRSVFVAEVTQVKGFLLIPYSNSRFSSSLTRCMRLSSVKVPRPASAFLFANPLQENAGCCVCSPFVIVIFITITNDIVITTQDQFIFVKRSKQPRQDDFLLKGYVLETRSSSLRTRVKDVVTLLGKSVWSISNVRRVRLTRDMVSISLGLKGRMQDRFSTRF